MWIHDICSVLFSDIYLKPQRSIRKFHFSFENQLAKPIFPLFSQMWNFFVASYPLPRWPLNNFCLSSKAVLCNGNLRINTFHSWRIRNMHVILLETVFNSHLITLDSRKQTFILHIFYTNMYICIFFTEKVTQVLK